MSKNSIICIDIELNSEEIEFCDYNSDLSLLDFDIIIFRPTISYSYYEADTYQGKPCLNDDASFRVREQSDHLRREIREAIDNGKTVFVFMPKIEDIFVGTGTKSTSGTGRNQKVTRHVAPFDSYQSLPIELDARNRSGNEIRLLTSTGSILKDYWQSFSDCSEYRVTFDSPKMSPLFVTRTGNKTVGALGKHASGGAIVLLPDLYFDDPAFTKVEHDDDGEAHHVWSEESEKFAKRLINSLVKISKQIGNDTSRSPMPDWVKSEDYSTKSEAKISADLLKLESRIGKLEAQKHELVEALDEANVLKSLLFENGKPLEQGILKALQLMGFEAEGFDDGESEFDAVFTAAEGRFLGEAEGKENKQINITKLRQLSLNIHEDLERDEVDAPAKAVLFGNAFRLKPLNERSDPFTDKCLSSAAVQSVALVDTTDLFAVAQYLDGKSDKRFAKKCRKALMDAVGVVSFPDIPAKKTITEVTSK